MVYHSNKCSQEVELYGKGAEVSFTAFRTAEDNTPIDWFFDETCIPFEQIEALTVGGSIAADSPINVLSFKNLRILQMAHWNTEFTGEFFRPLHPNPGAEVPCQSLREIQFTYWESLESLVSLVRERKRAGHQLGLVCLSSAYGFDEDLMEELKEHVGEVRIAG